jgi:hypothetical protein
MSPRLADVPPPLEPRGASPKNTFDREPILIPQGFATGRPWYRRRGTVVRVVIATLFIALTAAAVQRVTPERILRKFAKVVGG